MKHLSKSDSLLRISLSLSLSTGEQGFLSVLWGKVERSDEKLFENPSQITGHTLVLIVQHGPDWEKRTVGIDTANPTVCGLDTNLMSNVQLILICIQLNSHLLIWMLQILVIYTNWTREKLIFEFFPNHPSIFPETKERNHTMTNNKMK